MRRSNPLPQLIPQRIRRAKLRAEELVWSGWKDLAVRGGPINDRPVTLAEAKRQRQRPVRAGEHFGPARGGWNSRWFRVDVPAPVAGERGRRFLQWNCLGEAIAWLDGEPWAGLDGAHREVLLPDRACTLWIDSGTYATGIWAPGVEAIGAYGARFDSARIGVRDATAWKVAWDLDVLQQLVHRLLKQDGIDLSSGSWGHIAPYEKLSPLTRQLLGALDQAIDAFDREGLAAFSAALDDVMERFPAEPWQTVAAIVPHTHIDLVWLWPERETERKGVHSFATALRLMEQYPEYRFTCSQPALYRAIERLAPSQAKAIRRLIKAGRWEATGGFETEPDNQLPSGEALARSLAIGQRKFAELRGGEPSDLCWLPDVFGYAQCLPQILRLGGIGRFFTTKMAWSAITRFPYTSFVWRGADGSEVLAHLSPTTYNGSGEIDQIGDAVRAHRQADVHGELMLPHGLGDGGGGMTAGSIERIRRWRNLAGAPKARWTGAEAFFDRLEKVRDRLPTYQGELYLEYHRGTYTTQSEFKRLYRRAETALQAHEAVRVALAGKPIDEEAWRRVAFCQFHDAIPGSSIALVYEELCPELGALGDAALESARGELARRARGPGWTVFNPLPVPRTVLVELPAKSAAIATEAGAPVPVQAVGRGREARIVAAVALPALGGTRLVPARGAAPAAGIREASPRVLDNGALRAEFDAAGRLSGLTVDGQSLLISAPCGFALYHDHPMNFDAWDIDHYALRIGEPVADRLRLELVERGPARAVLRASAAIGAKSRLTVDYVLAAGSRWLQIEAAVDWREDHRLLKYHVRTAHRGRFARFGTPFGSILRPQVPGVASDEAMWEVPGSRWAAIGDEGLADGVAIVTEAKFGFSCRDGDLGLSLLRAPKHPDPTADIGNHRIRFAVGRHRPTTSGAALSTAAAADALYAPTVVTRGGGLPAPRFALEDLGSLVPSWVLPAAGGGWIQRLHECDGRRGTAILALSGPVREVALVDFLERRLGAPEKLGDGRFALDYEPYRIISVRVR